MADAADGAKVKGIVETVFKGLDETVSEYLVSLLSDDPHLGVRGFWSCRVFHPVGHKGSSSAVAVRPTGSVDRHILYAFD